MWRAAAAVVEMRLHDSGVTAVCGAFLRACVGVRSGAAALLGVAVVSAGVASPAAAPAAPNRVEVVTSSAAALARVLKAQPARIVRVLAPLHAVELEPVGDLRAFLGQARRTPGVVAARPVIPRASTADPALTTEIVSAPSEWQYGAAGVDRVPSGVLAAAAGLTIAVLDTGADTRAPDLAGKVAGTYDIGSGGRIVTDRSGHGTLVASLAAGSGANGAGVAGFGGAARLLVVKLADAPAFSDLDVAAGILYAARHGARIINLSVAGRTRSPVEQSAIEYAARRGILLVAAAGNDALNGNPPEYPAALLQPVGSNGAGGLGLAVGASDVKGARAPFSESGSFVSLAAPGASIFGAAHGVASGTSFAAPEVAGAAALVWAANPRLSARQVARILEESASGGGVWTPDLGFGVIDVAAAVEQAAEAAQG